MTGTVLVPDEACKYIESRGYSVRRVARDLFTVDELHAAIDGVSGYLIGGYEEPLAEHFERADDLEAVAWIGTDYMAYVPGWKRACERGVAFINAPGSNTASVAEFTLLLALSMMRPFVSRVASLNEVAEGSSSPGRDLFGRQLGIIGFGRIGARVARIARQGFDMAVVYTAPRRNEVLECAIDVKFVTKRDLLVNSDLITIHRPGPAHGEGPELGQADFRTMKRGAVLVNCAHHELVNLESLAWAIENRGVRAAFDGIATGSAWERLLQFGTDRFLAVPSMAFNTYDANLRASMRTATAACDILSGGTSTNVTNPEFRDVRVNRS